MILFAILLIGVLALLLFPLFQKNGLDLIYLDYTVDERKQLKQKKANVVLIIKELDFDYETGKLSKEDYVALRNKYEAQAVDIMKNIEQAEEAWINNLKKVEQGIKQVRVQYEK